MQENHTKNNICKQLYFSPLSVPSTTVWESDDTLSDGGDFFEWDNRPTLDVAKIKATLHRNAIPIVPARKVSGGKVVISMSGIVTNISDYA